ncbi:protein adenylyltransferase SelO [Aplysia californica]|uniref:Selenoprotein O n=1 Tax=Aplysia californica TaxID=6500 RepID=A0ABM0K6I2_APLCA|nr:protein adenylyltransferase SelO [Aplysia californica]
MVGQLGCHDMKGVFWLFRTLFLFGPVLKVVCDDFCWREPETERFGRFVLEIVGDDRRNVPCWLEQRRGICSAEETKAKVGFATPISPHYDCLRNPEILYSSFQEWLTCFRQSLKDTFPVDKVKGNFVRTVRNALFSHVNPTGLKSNVKLCCASKAVLTDCLDLHPTVTVTDLFIDFMNGNNRSGLFPPSLAHRYGGHQFGHWAGQLGDGRAILLGDYQNRKGERWELQLKGSGKTPYSRAGDGRAVLRSSVREFLASEAMHYLGVPTSRAAALIVSDDEVVRDQFYDGHPLPERTAIVLRLAPSWFRIGSLEILSYTGETELLRLLLDNVIKSFFVNIDINSQDKYLMLFQEIVSSTAHLIAQWQGIGFAHGVCNTDNFSLLSITIDYGPFGFMDAYDPKFVPNFSDDEKRYSFENQPDVGFFNMEKLLRALEPVLRNQQIKSASIILKGYVELYKSFFLKVFAKKFGFNTVKRHEDENLIATFLKILEDTGADFTMSFRELGEISFMNLTKGEISKSFWALRVISQHEWFQHFINLYNIRLKSEDITDHERQKLMNKNNPRYVLRNWIAQRAISAVEKNDFAFVHRLQKVLEKPFSKQDDAEVLGFASKPPQWAANLFVSCSS